ncbi:YdeI/OmpD-associated family protein [Gracilimonas mengyeensis]|uniref:Uncharacterized conserved protein YdeI, YjbR/CyaY-like superfamily, DUF1801 family n=1 Tax=Gracilimonas mengyeensis TaxID=1302730 RepID=A0A521EPE9_9BACT|nr:DUF1801 domain-containing protein [Gracilimonas mengyeensis]SMO85797.1 Uncharacterized conserved protein YdeI, YjbR/CyaY-like superfamily, DUF1801 family [Gracilimonas mengyeensis]
MGKTVDDFISKNKKWQAGLEELRKLILASGLEETIKWGQPVYTLEDKNVVGIGAFKSYFGLWFFNGALLNDPGNHLHNAQEGKTKALRQLRFQSKEEMDKSLIKDFLEQAITNQKDGKEVDIDTKREPEIPEMLSEAFEENTELHQQFKALTPGRQREYAGYIREAKKQETKERRLKKIIPIILAGKGLNDRY